jgi:hypothetical protein
VVVAGKKCGTISVCLKQADLSIGALVVVQDAKDSGGNMPRIMPKEINAIGIELEGGWSFRRARGNRPKGGGEFKGDGSVHMQDFSGFLGEATSVPMTSWKQAASWVKDNYPDRVNETCGMHVHMSFKDSTYSMLAESPGIVQYHIDRLRRYMDAHRNKFPRSEYNWMVGRLNGDNSYCSPRWLAEGQLSRFNGERYTMMNFQAWHGHRTLEVRTLGMVTEKKRAVDLLWILIKSIRDYKRELCKTTQKGRKILAYEGCSMTPGKGLVRVVNLPSNGLIPVTKHNGSRYYLEKTYYTTE